MLQIKTLLLLTVSTFIICACGGAVEGGDTPTDDTTAPNFVGGDPLGTVAEACSVTAEFDEAIAEASITDQSFSIVEIISGEQLTEANGDGTWGLSTSSDTIALFAPNITLSLNEYQVTITTDITDTAGNALAAGDSWILNQQIACPPELN